MAIGVEVGSFEWSSSDAATTEYSISTSFAVKAAFVWITGRSDATDAVGAPTSDSANEAVIAYGFGTGTSARYTAMGYTREAVGTTDTAAGAVNDAILGMVDAANAQVAALDISAMERSGGGNGITFVVDDQSPITARVGYLLLGGDDLTNVACGDYGSPATATTVAETGLGFQPTMLFLMPTVATAFPDTLANMRFPFGFTDGSAEAAIALWTEQNVGTTNTAGYSITSESVGLIVNAGTLLERASIQSFDADGFTMSYAEANSSARLVPYLALRGGQYKVGSINSSTSTGSIAETGVGFTPTALLMVSTCRTESTTDTPTPHAMLSIGATDGTNEHAQGFRAEDNVGTSNVCTAIEYDSVYVRIDETTDAVDGSIGFTSFDADGFTVNQDVADDAAVLIHYVAIGDAAGIDIPVAYHHYRTMMGA